MKVSDYVIQFLADLGIRHIFYVSGGGAMHLNDSLGQNEQLEGIGSVETVWGFRRSRPECK